MAPPEDQDFAADHFSATTESTGETTQSTASNPVADFEPFFFEVEEHLIEKPTDFLPFPEPFSSEEEALNAYLNGPKPRAPSHRFLAREHALKPSPQALIFPTLVFLFFLSWMVWPDWPTRLLKFLLRGGNNRTIEDENEDIGDNIIVSMRARPAQPQARVRSKKAPSTPAKARTTSTKRARSSSTKKVATSSAKKTPTKRGRASSTAAKRGRSQSSRGRTPAATRARTPTPTPDPTSPRRTRRSRAPSPPQDPPRQDYNIDDYYRDLFVWDDEDENTRRAAELQRVRDEELADALFWGDEERRDRWGRPLCECGRVRMGVGMGEMGDEEGSV